MKCGSSAFASRHFWLCMSMYDFITSPINFSINRGRRAGRRESGWKLWTVGSTSTSLWDDIKLSAGCGHGAEQARRKIKAKEARLHCSTAVLVLKAPAFKAVWVCTQTALNEIIYWLHRCRHTYSCSLLRHVHQQYLLEFDVTVRTLRPPQKGFLH